MRRLGGMRWLLAALGCLLLAPASAATLPVQGVTLPVFRTQVPAGGGSARSQPAAFDPSRTVDGNVSDWTGQLPGFGGAMIYSHSELVYQDHIWDAYGPA